jgi:hypothetical protein
VTRPLKINGLDELRSLARRTKNLYALGRIGEDDFRFILPRLQEVEARIISMPEFNADGEEVTDGDE